MNDEQGEQPVSAAGVREATFPQARRGYNREAVHAFLDRVADWVEGTTAEAADVNPKLSSEFTKVGERTAGILAAAEESATKLRREAKDYADRLRSSAEGDTRKLKLSVSQKADQLLADAESKAAAIIDEANTRRLQLSETVANLIERRDEIANEAQRLADQLLKAVDAIRSDHTLEDAEDGPADSRSLEEGDAGAEAERSRLIRAGFSPGTPPQQGEPTEG